MFLGLGHERNNPLVMHNMPLETCVHIKWSLVLHCWGCIQNTLSKVDNLLERRGLLSKLLTAGRRPPLYYSAHKEVSITDKFG